jgi:hypothetical protein
LSPDAGLELLVDVHDTVVGSDVDAEALCVLEDNPLQIAPVDDSQGRAVLVSDRWHQGRGRQFFVVSVPAQRVPRKQVGLFEELF